ncbi:MAG: hypothetical protein CK424_08215 [Legionella sp.]|nr:MAG: hypothetical protein CK424_08215 [Legionella sp.]
MKLLFQKPAIHLLSIAVLGLGCQTALAKNSSDSLTHIFEGGPAKEQKESVHWQGLYIGANAGWGWSKFSSTETPFGAAAVLDIIPQSVSAKMNGPLFGGQIGYNFMYRDIVLGIEVDANGTGISGYDDSSSTSLVSLAQIPDGSSDNGFTYQENTKVLGTVRGRIGTTHFWDSSLVYVTAGGAWRQIKNNVTMTGNVVGTNHWSGVGQDNFNSSQSGYVVGAGGEWMIAPHWTVRAEYLFYGFNDTQNRNTNFPISAPSGAGITTTTTNNNINAVRLGVNYLI